MVSKKSGSVAENRKNSVNRTKVTKELAKFQLGHIFINFGMAVAIFRNNPECVVKLVKRAGK